MIGGGRQKKKGGTRGSTKGGETVVLGDLGPADVQKYLEGLDFPASKEAVASTAESNGAPQALVEQIRALGPEEFSSPDDVVSALPLKSLGL